MCYILNKPEIQCNVTAGPAWTVTAACNERQISTQKLTKEYFGRQGSPHNCTADYDGPPDVLLELYDKRAFVPNERFAQDVRNLLLPHWGSGNRGVWAKGKYGNGPLGADQFFKLELKVPYPWVKQMGLQSPYVLV